MGNFDGIAGVIEAGAPRGARVDSDLPPVTFGNVRTVQLGSQLPFTNTDDVDIQTVPSGGGSNGHNR